MVRKGRRYASSKDDISILSDSAISLTYLDDSNKNSDDETKENVYELEAEALNGNDESDDDTNSSLVKTKQIVKKTNRKADSPSKCRKEHMCEICLKKFRGKTDLKRHVLIHSGERPHVCDLCGKGFRQAVNLKNHKIIVHDGQKQYACELCPKTFALKERLRLHLRIHSGEKPYECKICNKRFGRGGQLTQHMLTNHENSSKKHTCDKCSAKFLTAGNLRAHLKRHEEGLDTFCTDCKEHFPNAVILQTHINKVHTKINDPTCEICNESIKSEDLVSHMKEHSKHKIHVCSFCNACFSQKSQYNVHIRMHTGERPYQCRICLQSFAHSSVLKLHIRKHTGEKPFDCVLCKDSVAFSQLAHLKTHMKKVHHQQNPYFCEACNTFFKTKADLQFHKEDSKSCMSDNEDKKEVLNESQDLSNLRFLIAILLKKISSEQKLKQLGFEKRLIDNVVIASLKLASRKTFEDKKMSSIDRLRLNIQEFLSWIVPEQIMDQFLKEELSIDTMLEKIVTSYIKQGQCA